MRLLPFEKIVLDIPLPVDQVVNELLAKGTRESDGNWTIVLSDQDSADLIT